MILRACPQASIFCTTIMLFRSTIHLSLSYVWCTVHRQNFWTPIFIVPSASGPLLLRDFWIQWEWIWIWREWIWERKRKNAFSLWQQSLNSIIMLRKDIIFVQENFEVRPTWSLMRWSLRWGKMFLVVVTMMFVMTTNRVNYGLHTNIIPLEGTRVQKSLEHSQN